jgi:uncharacterized protein
MSPVPSVAALLAEVRSGALLGDTALHGERHWQRVALAGSALCDHEPGADPLVVSLFALLHDACRFDDGYDPAHGPRAAALVGRLARKGVLCLKPDRLSLLRRACARHTHGFRSDNPTLGICWDADRMDLRRLHMEVDPKRISSPIDGFHQVMNEIGLETSFPGWDSFLR